jgi:hypothetical protein
MELTTAGARPTGMMIRGLAAAGLLCAALAGCGTAVASSSPTPTTPGHSGAAPGTTASPAGGCAGVKQATSVTIARHVTVAEPVNGGTRTVTQRNATLVRAVFGDFCAALAHADVPQPPIDCPADFGVYYVGKFYDGQRALATFVYDVGGCQRLGLTANGQTRATFVLGKAAAAAPHLRHDFAAVLGRSQRQVYGSPGPTQVNQGK